MNVYKRYTTEKRIKILGTAYKIKFKREGNSGKMI